MPVDAVLQRHAIQKLHGDEHIAVLVINLVNGANIQMIQSNTLLGFALETAESLRIFGYVVGQELQGYEPSEFDILGFVNHSHPAAAKFLHDAEMLDGLTDE